MNDDCIETFSPGRIIYEEMKRSVQTVLTCITVYVPRRERQGERKTRRKERERERERERESLCLTFSFISKMVFFPLSIPSRRYEEANVVTQGDRVLFDG